jgi:hypothetical protein
MVSMALITFSARAEGATIWTDKDNYGPSDTVTIFGSGFLPNAQVTITITAPDSSVATIYAWTDESGGFVAYYTLDGMEGTYTVTATDGTNTATTTFTEKIEIKTYKDSAYTVEENVFYQGDTVYAKATDLDSHKSYKIQWYYDDVLKRESSETTGVTSLTDSYTLAANAEIGTWYAKILEWDAKHSKWDVKDTATFYVWHQIAPTADSWVESDNPNKNYGSDTTLHVKVVWDEHKKEVTNVRRTYLKFDLSGLPSGVIIDSAILHMYRTKDNDIPSAYTTGDAWTETGITWNNQPGPGTFICDGALESDNWFKWDLTSYVASEFAGDKIVSVVLKFKDESGSDQHMDFTSREGTWNQRPWLEISYHMPPPTATVTFSQVGVGTDFSGVVLTVDGTYYGVNDLPKSFTWNVGTDHSFEYYSRLTVNGKQYVWTRTEGLSTAQSGTIHVESGGGTVTAYYKTQYLVTFTQTGSGVAPTVTYSIDSGTPVSDTVPFSVWVDSGSSISYTYQDIVYDGADTRYVLTEVNPASPQTVTSSLTITGTYKTQYYLSVVSPYDTPSGMGWYDAGATAYATLAYGTEDLGQGKRAVFTGWTGDASGTGLTSDPITMNGPKTAIALWVIQWYLNVSVAPPEAGTVSGEGWYNNCTTVTLTAPEYLPSEEGTNGVRYKFSYWDVDGTAKEDNPIYVHMDAPHIATAHYTPQYCLTVKTEPAGIKVWVNNVKVDTPYQCWYNPCTEVTITAPLEPNETYLFAYWTVDTTPEPFLENVITVHMDGPKTATAVYKDYLGHAREEIEALKAHLNDLRAAGKIGKHEYDYFMKALNAIEKDIARGMKQLDRERRGFNDRQKGFEDLRHAVMKIKRLIHQVENWAKKGKIPAADAANIISELETIRMKLVNKAWAEALAEKALALKAIADAKAQGKDTTKAEAELIKVDRELAKAIQCINEGKYSQAIQHFKHAFTHSQHAVKKAYDPTWDTDYKDWIDELEEEEP